jgi:hypothetical protein
VVASLAVAGLGACSDEEPAAPTTTTLLPATTITAPGQTPDEAFDQALSAQLDGLDPTFVGGSRAAGHTLCDNLTSLAEEAGSAGEADDPSPALLIGVVFDGFSQPGVAAVVLRATGEHLCPEHLEAIEEVLATKGQ